MAAKLHGLVAAPHRGLKLRLHGLVAALVKILVTPRNIFYTPVYKIKKIKWPL